MVAGGKRTSSTKGRHIVQVNPLNKGLACQTCRARKVRCSGEKPACRACLRTARFEGRDLSQVCCSYDGKAWSANGGKGKRRTTKAPQQGGGAQAESSRMAAQGLVEVPPNSAYSLPLPDPYMAAAYPPVYDGSSPFLPPGIVAAPPPSQFGLAPTPPLSYTSSASPEDSTLAYSPPDTAATVPSGPASVYDYHPSASTSTWTPLPPVASTSSSSAPRGGVLSGPSPPLPPSFGTRGSASHPGVLAGPEGVPYFEEGGRGGSRVFYAIPVQHPLDAQPGGIVYGSPYPGGGPSSYAHQHPPYATQLPPLRKATAYDHPSSLPLPPPAPPFNVPYAAYANPHPHPAPSPIPAYYRTSPAPLPPPRSASAADPTFSLPLSHPHPQHPQSRGSFSSTGTAPTRPSSVLSQKAVPVSVPVGGGGGSVPRPTYLPMPSPGLSVYATHPHATPPLPSPTPSYAQHQHQHQHQSQQYQQNLPPHASQRGTPTGTPGFARVDSWLQDMGGPANA